MEEHAQALEEAWTGPRQAFVPAPDTRIVEEPGLTYVLTPSVVASSFNEVWRVELSDEDADAAIDRVIAAYRARGRASKWIVTDESRPRDLVARLEARGLVAWGARAMACEPSLAITTPPDVAVEPVDVANEAEYCETLLAGFGQPDDATFAAVVARTRACIAPRHRLYLARIDGAPVGAASWAALPRSAYLGGAAVAPAFRGRGVYRALVAARLADARAHGYGLATTQAREATSAPILARLGVRTLARFVVVGPPSTAPPRAAPPTA
ncbi:MAG: GNAT family N-acetyltransferase [Sandaracinaceae bacterium]|nr:GNAT family N-acetyltransferase [Sandaracinaceae bacterium]